VCLLFYFQQLLCSLYKTKFKLNWIPLQQLFLFVWFCCCCCFIWWY
jgi:hypothetical protein